MNFEAITEARRKAIADSIRSISTEEVKSLGETLFPYHEDPWREAFFGFLAEHPHASFHHAKSDDGVEILYCHQENRGIWFLPKSGVGPLQARGLEIMNDAVLGK
ncbi:MAG TPA: hypothetical protein VNB29_02170 [Chthoniobacterales bacterium]|nr:hypothetical protein [Chthoniobacterales bacterium]